MFSFFACAQLCKIPEMSLHLDIPRRAAFVSFACLFLHGLPLPRNSDLVPSTSSLNLSRIFTRLFIFIFLLLTDVVT